MLSKADANEDGPNISGDGANQVVQYGIRRVKHHVPCALPKVYFQFASDADVRSFASNARIVAANIRNPETISLHVEVERGGGAQGAHGIASRRLAIGRLTVPFCGSARACAGRVKRVLGRPQTAESATVSQNQYPDGDSQRWVSPSRDAREMIAPLQDDCEVTTIANKHLCLLNLCRRAPRLRASGDGYPPESADHFHCRHRDALRLRLQPARLSLLLDPRHQRNQIINRNLFEL
jgi:hypothetical protein